MYMNVDIFFTIEALNYRQKKAECPAHGPPKCCHALPVGPEPHIDIHGYRPIESKLDLL